MFRPIPLLRTIYPSIGKNRVVQTQLSFIGLLAAKHLIKQKDYKKWTDMQREMDDRKKRYPDWDPVAVDRDVRRVLTYLEVAHKISACESDAREAMKLWQGKS